MSSTLESSGILIVLLIAPDKKGWTEDIMLAKTYQDLPAAARNFVDALEEIVGVPVGYISVGPDREATIVRNS